MGLPKRRVSKARRDKRRTHQKLAVARPTLCSHCGQPKPPHRICPHCGYYRGRRVVIVD
ncbi:MAG: 50S ribosomal protein L32 [Candidatus Latescibacterota bacterium]|nr:MAG: 50S ribosomal protein L32 [Candidatus Latescibacterota bacterium]